MQLAARQNLARPCVLVFAGHDPSGGAGIAADIEAIAAQGAHALTVITTLTVQDHNQVFNVYPVDIQIVREQTHCLIAGLKIAAIKIGLLGSIQMAEEIVRLIAEVKEKNGDIPVVLDPVLSSGRGNALGVDDAVGAVLHVLPYATLLTPNLPEMNRLYSALVGESDGLTKRPDLALSPAQILLRGACTHVLLKGGHADEAGVVNRWFQSAVMDKETAWNWRRLPDEFHGSGCTLASAIAALLALGKTMEASLTEAQQYTQSTLAASYFIGDGQRIPQRLLTTQVQK